LFIDPAPVSLPTPDLIADLVVRGKELFVAKDDLSDFYHCLLTPEWLSLYMAMPPVKASEVAIAGYDDSVELFPCCLTLPMGFKHSVLLAQLAHEHLLSSA